MKLTVFVLHGLLATQDAAAVNVAQHSAANAAGAFNVVHNATKAVGAVSSVQHSSTKASAANAGQHSATKGAAAARAVQHFAAKAVGAFKVADSAGHHPRVNHLRSNAHRHVISAVHHPPVNSLGNKKCPCIGFDDIQGETTAIVKTEGGMFNMSYPADLGATCQAWDSGHHPDCGGEDPPAWCMQSWCYVDPRDCDIPVLPKQSSYQPEATYQMMPLYYSYATCDAEDHWTVEIAEIGLAGCRCVGIAESPGTTMANIEGTLVPYPAEIGGECRPWDDKHHPDCMKENKPDWCAKEWCFVDPCSCTAPVPPKVSTYLSNATFQGRPVFWSYATCGSEDTYSTIQQQRKSEDLIEETCEEKTEVAKTEEPKFGNSECPCVGFDDIEGDTEVVLALAGGTDKIFYPADMGASCKAWDATHHPDCLGDSPPSWCDNRWCYVDPRKCNLDVLPKPATYMPKATFQGLPVYFSYATCDAEDEWTESVPEVGEPGCRCIGFADSPGTTLVDVGGRKLEYPAEVGGECKAWDATRHPACKGKDRPEWCATKWCFVDPCSCTVDKPPQLATYLGNATFQGRPIFWSARTCGEPGHSLNEEEQETLKEFIGGVCSGKIEVEHSGSRALRPFLALAAALLLLRN